MERWRGKRAVVTGASAGIGAAVCVALADAGLNVVGLARRPHLVERLQSEVKDGSLIVARQCDVSSMEQVESTFEWIDKTFGGVDILVNNAGVNISGHITDLGGQQASDADILSVIDTNFKAVVMCCRRAVSSMHRRGVAGHVININSIAGHYIPLKTEFNVYASTKHAVTAFTASLLNELASLHANIKLTSISPGLVNTSMGEITEAAWTNRPILEPKDIADAVLYVISTPPTVNITELTIQPVGEKKL